LPQNLKSKSKIGQTGISFKAGYRSCDALQTDNVYSTLSTGQRVSEVRSTFVYNVGCGATGRQSCPILGFQSIFPIQNPKTYLSVTSLQPRGYIAEWFRRFPATSGRGAGDPQIFAYGKWLYPFIMLLHGASDLDQRCLKTHNSEDECTFPPKITPKPHSWGRFNAKPIILRQSHVNGATTLKLYGYIGIGKNLGLC